MSNSYQIKPQMINNNIPIPISFRNNINNNNINNRLNTMNNNINKNLNSNIKINTDFNQLKINKNKENFFNNLNVEKLFENYDIEHNIFEIITLFILIIGIIVYIYQLVLDFYETNDENDVRKYHESLWMICMIIILFIGFFMSYNCIYNC